MGSETDNKEINKLTAWGAAVQKDMMGGEGQGGSPRTGNFGAEASLSLGTETQLCKDLREG